MKDEQILSILISLISGGGLVAVVNSIGNRKKNSSDITQSNIETAIKLKDSAVSEYNSAEEKLKKARMLLDEVQEELDTAKDYIDTLLAILDKHNIEYPKVKWNRRSGKYE